jgi:thioredoxin reductase (NADPH)
MSATENLLIVGSGPAGLTAAIYAARANLQPVLVEGIQPGGQLTTTTEIENFPGFAQPIAGPELMERMRAQAERLGVRLAADEVTGCLLRPPVHTLRLSAGTELAGRAVIIATGASARYLGLPSEQQLMGRGVSGCAVCDGSFFRGQDVAVVGGGDTAMEDALYLARIARRVTVIHRRDAFRASRIMGGRVLAHPQIQVIWNAVVEEVADVAKGEVTGLRLRDVKTGERRDLTVQGVFIAVGHTPNTAAFRGQVALDDEGYVRAVQSRTDVPGVFAAGDVQDRVYRQAVTAAASGCMAAIEAERYLGSLP